MLWNTIWYMYHALWYNVVHVSCSAVQCGTCIMLWSTMWYISCSEVQCGTKSIMFWSTMWYMYHALKYNAVYIMFCSTMWYMFHALKNNVVHVSCSEVQRGTCIMLWSTMWYMYHALRYNVVHVSCSEVQCGTCNMLWSTMWYMYHALRYNVVHVSCSEVQCGTCIVTCGSCRDRRRGELFHHHTRWQSGSASDAINIAQHSDNKEIPKSTIEISQTCVNIISLHSNFTAKLCYTIYILVIILYTMQFETYMLYSHTII